jgi:hypothetical protein
LLCRAAGWDKRWTKSTWKQSDGTAGEFKLTKGKWGDDEGIQTGPDSKFFAIYSEMAKPVNNEKKELVLQVSASLAAVGPRAHPSPHGDHCATFAAAVLSQA